MKSLQAEVIVSESSLFMVVFGDCSCPFSLRRSLVVVGGLHLIGKPPKNTFEKVPFLLVRFLWANKENEQQHGKHILIMITQSNYLSAANRKYLGYLCPHNRIGRDPMNDFAIYFDSPGHSHRDAPKVLLRSLWQKSGAGRNRALFYLKLTLELNKNL